MLLALFFVLPLVALLLQLLPPDVDIWSHLWDNVLPSYLGHSVVLMLMVGFGAACVGVSTAWLVACHDFPGRRFFSLALILPMAMPAYIVAYAYTWFFDFSGPLQALIRGVFDWRYGDYWFPNIRSLGGAAWVLTLVLYPYVYMLCRSSFANQSKRLSEANEVLGQGRWHFFRRIAMPLSRPALVAGLTLVMMETLADYGTVEYFGVQTLTTGVVKTWFGLGSLSGASQVAALILMLVVIILLVERWQRGKAQFIGVHGGQQKVSRVALHGVGRWLASLWCFVVCLFGFILPMLLLLYMAFLSRSQIDWGDFLALAWHSFSLAGLVALVIVVLAISLMVIKRRRPHSHLSRLVGFLNFGYAVPGLVIAVGVTMAMGWLDQAANTLWVSFGGQRLGLVFSGGFFALIMAYAIRFLAVANQPIGAAYQGIPRHLDESSSLLGKSTPFTFFHIHLPLLKGSLLTALLLVFVDLLKELPATLVLRPFNFNTLAVKAYEMASDERLIDAALPALLIVAVGLLPVLILNRKTQHE